MPCVITMQLLLLAYTLSTGTPALKVNQTLRPTYGFFTVLKRNFNSWDINHDGILTGDEISQDLQNPSIIGKEAAALAALKTQERFDWRADNKQFASFTNKQIDDLQNGFSNGNKQARALVSYYKRCLSKLEHQSPILFRYDYPHITSIRQGHNSDCYFLSSVASLAEQRPQEFMDMFKENSNGTYTVCFKHPGPITVQAPTPAEYATYPDAAEDGAWLTVIEKAYGESLLRSENCSLVEPFDPLVLHGGFAGRVLANITGHRTKYYNFKNPEVRNKVPEALSEAFNRRHAVVADMPGHVLAVVRFDAEQNLVLIWNPWGSDGYYKPAGEKMEHGCFWMSLSDFLERFKGVTIEEGQPFSAKEYVWSATD